MTMYWKRTPTVPLAVAELVTEGAWAADAIVIVSVKGWPVPAALEAVRWTVKRPAAAGVPVITPEVDERVSPTGRLSALNRVGVLLARIV